MRRHRMADFYPEILIQPVLQSPPAVRTRKGGRIAFDITDASRLDQRIHQPGELSITATVVPADPAKQKIKRLLRETRRIFEIPHGEVDGHSGGRRTFPSNCLIFAADV